MSSIKKSVGEGGVNASADVKVVQKLINRNLHLMPGQKKLVEDGKIGKNTKGAIGNYQRVVMKMRNPDSLVEPGRNTIKTLEKNDRKPRPSNVITFIKKTLPAAKKVKAKYKIPVSVLIAQAALESGWGRHVKDNAYFGIKAHRTTGGTTSFTTTEYINGKKVTMTDSFRSYKNFDEAAEDYGKFLTTNPRYKPAFAHSHQPLIFCDKLQAAGYATDPRYATKLRSIITNYYLNEYDK
jgi:flagellum-specific peptidoglycan hydrolase FlgJ